MMSYLAPPVGPQATVYLELLGLVLCDGPLVLAVHRELLSYGVPTLTPFIKFSENNEFYTLWDNVFRKYHY